MRGLCPVKTPLSSAYDARLTAEQRWTPAQCIAACGKRKVVLVVDLTNTERYYDKHELAALGVRHLKVATHGRGLPSDQQMRDIFDALREAMPAVGATAGATAGAAGAADEKQAQGLAELASAVSGDTASLGGGAVSGGAAAAAGAKGESSVAIIHCTHGLNRTGYVVARALVELHGYTLVDALDAFAAIRSPGLWREEYVRDLRGRYGGP